MCTQPEKLPEAELDIMLCLWQYAEPVRTSKIQADLAQSHSWTLSTLKALLGRLEERGFIQVTREGRFTLYQALVSEADYRRRETGSILRRYYQNSAKCLIAALVEEHPLDADELEEIQQILQEAKKHQDEK